MLPLNLVIQAFGAYASRVEIPFSKLNSNLYLISGETGSGKTTIFDAILFALFNATAGSNRNTDSLRSDFAAENTESFVEFEFMYNGEIYKVRRTPSYLRKKLRGEGTTPCPQTAELYLPNSTVISKPTEVDKNISELLGLEARQFSQIALLAQGEFLKLLNTETEERGKIFRTIFKTQDYLDFQEILKTKTFTLSSDCQSLKKSILQYISQIKTDDEKIVEIIDKNIQNSVLVDLSELFNLLKEKNKFDKKEIEALEKNIKDKNETASNISKTLESIKRKKNLTQDSEKLDNQLKELESAFLSAKSEFSKLETKQKELQELKLNLNDLEDDYKKVTQIKDLEKTLEKIQKETVFVKNDLENAGSEINKAKLSHIEYLYFEYLVSEDNLLKLQADFEAFQQEYNKKNNEFNTEYNAYLSSQAGILASNLKKDEPCPVCGSKTHPKPAQMSEKTLSKDELEENKVKLNQMQQELNLRSENCKILKTKNEEKLNNFNKVKKGYNLEFSEDSITLKTKIAKKDYEKLISTLETEKEENKALLAQKELELTKTRSTKQTLEKSLKTNPENLDLILDEHKKLTQKIKESEKEIKKINDDYNALNLKKTELSSKKEVFIKQLEELKDIALDDFEKFDEQITLINDDIKKLDKSKNNLITQLEINSGLLDKLIIEYKNYEELEKDYLNHQNLYNCAAGQIKGRAKITFEQYIQGYYLDLVLIEANKRFKTMTKGRYIFKRKTEFKNNQSKNSLDIEVMDFYTFKQRSTKTLSGGESFMAALSLALGLSDVISNQSGAVNINTLFIDEGFGSLDSESLDLAMSVISDLSQNDRKIGIISHIEDLKNNIEHRINTIKSDKGSTVEINF